MIETVILAAEAVAEPTVVTPFEEALLGGLVFVIMFGLGAGLTPRDFRLAIRRPWGLIIGWVTQFGFMPLISYLLVVTLLFPFFPPFFLFIFLLFACPPVHVPAIDPQSAASSSPFGARAF